MRICYFGTYDPSFPRNAVIIKGLRQNDVEVVECNTKAWANTGEKIAVIRGGLASLSMFRLALCYLHLLAKYCFMRKHDLIMVGYAGHLDVFFAKALAVLARKPLVFDAFLSLYETSVEDRHLVDQRSMRAKLMRFVDRCSSILSDLVLLDTYSHIQYFVEQFKLPASKFRRVLATADDDYRPAVSRQASAQFKVIYFGQFIPLHGVEYVIEAAAILASRKHIRFTLCGTGQTLEEMKAKALALKLENVEFMETWMSPSNLNKLIDGYDLCLGTFGRSGKALRVIPNKVFVALAKGKPVLSGDSSAMREVFRPGETIFLCSPGDPTAIAESIEYLAGDEGLRNSVAENGHSLYEELLRPEAIGSELKKTLEGMCKARDKRS